MGKICSPELTGSESDAEERDTNGLAGWEAERNDSVDTSKKVLLEGHVGLRLEKRTLFG
jgi:hypothetical protein